MSRTRSAEVAKRNDTIYAEWVRGASITSLGEKYSLSRQLVGRIVAERHPEEDDDHDRSVYRGFMWRLFDEVQAIGEAPGFKFRPDGRPAEDLKGNPALDTQVQVQAKELQLKIIRELRLLDGRDRPQKRSLTIEIPEAQREMQEAIEAERRKIEEALRRGVVPGQVIRELPSGQEPS